MPSMHAVEHVCGMSLNRIDQKFRDLRAEGRSGFIGYITAGDPDLQTTPLLALALEKAGVDILEIALPFSDPLADGIVNQMAAQRALEAGATTRGVFDAVREIRKSSQLPIVLYTYMNPLYRYGFAEFHRDASEAGIDGLLILDLPPDEAQRNAGLSEHGDLACITLIAPTTPAERIDKIVKGATGFIYCISREGVTGAQSQMATNIAERVALIKEHTDLPVAVGFGVSTPEHVKSVASCADAVVVGSAIVKKMEEHAKDPDRLITEVSSFVAELVRGIPRPG